MQSDPHTIDYHLEKTSRTYALAIPLLPEPLRDELSVAYLLLRIGDTFEDADQWNQAKRIKALQQFENLLLNPDLGNANDLAASSLSDPPCKHPGYLDLIKDTSVVISHLMKIPLSRQRGIAHHVIRTLQGMQFFVSQGGADGSLQISHLEDLRNYCYIVAGIVGELFTTLVVDHHRSLLGFERILFENAARVGESLQLVNILKDSMNDAKDKRVYIPKSSDQASIVNLIQEDFQSGTKYIKALQEGGAQSGCVAFTALPLLLGRKTLDIVQKLGPGAKISRSEVYETIAKLTDDLEKKKFPF